MKKNDIYVYIGDVMYDPNVFDLTFPQDYEATKFERYKILAIANGNYCYIASATKINGIIMKCMKSNLITLAEYRKLKIENLL